MLLCDCALENMNNIRDSIILSGKERIVKLLQVIKENPKLSFSELGTAIKKTKVKSLSSTSFWNTLKDARLMGLVENGYGFIISPLGEDFIIDSSDAIKKAHFNIKLFSECYAQIPNESNYIKVRDWFMPYLNKLDKRLRGTVIRRYLEGIYRVNVPKKPRVNIKGITSNAFIGSVDKFTQKEEERKNNRYYFEILKDDGYTDEELTAIETALSSVLPKDKVWRILHKKVKIEE